MSDDQVFLGELEDADTLSERRTDVAYAREVIEKLLPEEGLRRQFLTFMADCIELAHDHAPGAWEITLTNNKLNMNFARVLVLMVVPSTVQLLFPVKAGTDVIGDKKLQEIVEQGISSEPFASLPNGYLLRFAPDVFPQLSDAMLPFLIQEYEVLFPSGCKPSASTSFKRAHSPGVLEYMREYLSRDLPDPAYYERAVSEAGASSDWRNEEASARQIIERLLPDEKLRRPLLSLMADCIEMVHDWVPSAWHLTLQNRMVALNAGRYRILSAYATSGWFVVPLEPQLSSGQQDWWQNLQGEIAGFSSLPSLALAHYIKVPHATLAVSLVDLDPFLKEQYRTLLPTMCPIESRDPYTRAHSPGVLKYMRGYLSRDLPDPDYAAEREGESGEGRSSEEFVLKEPLDLLSVLREGTTSRNLHYTDEQLAAYFTALQTKGFVILSGISGTGKTKLAQTLADMLPQSATKIVDDFPPRVIIRPYMLKYKQIAFPKALHTLFRVPDFDEKNRIMVYCAGESTDCSFAHYSNPDGDIVQLNLSGSVGSKFLQTFQVDDKAYLDFTIDDDGELKEVTILTEEEAAQRSSGKTRPIPNVLFESVRTDWRDSKSLLGYYNPLTGAYMWTDFLRFVLRAIESCKLGEKTAWFVIFDEMNLARVEYYFSDLLSVLESGKGQDGLTKEPLRLNMPQDAEGDLPPLELRLPPNLYIVGTVNVDETTYSFSPKVLDRAFTLELNDVDFASYVPSAATEGTLERSEALLNILVGDNKFQHNSKQQVAECLERIPWLRERLVALNVTLQPHKMHVGYRIFDEIACYVQTAYRSSIYDSLGATGQPLIKQC